MKIIWTFHAEERLKQWRRSHGITKKEVEALVSNPEQIVPGDMGTMVAQQKMEDGLIRSPFVEVADGRKILTVYFTSKIKKYWNEE